jgi:hypothetical protein
MQSKQDQKDLILREDFNYVENNLIKLKLVKLIFWLRYLFPWDQVTSTIACSKSLTLGIAKSVLYGYT